MMATEMTENKNQSRHTFEKKHVASFRNMLKECKFMDTGNIFTVMIGDHHKSTILNRVIKLHSFMIWRQRNPNIGQNVCQRLE